ncbi:MAG: hypothetical protein CMJ49_06460 [Planctomycetaceae bacterium]|nr:hypothetical protein [Planctomycetaceae bacterium]
MSVTRTGGFGIGFRRLGGWQSDLGAVIAWAKANEFECIDVGVEASDVKQIIDAGLAVGSADLPGWSGLITADKAKRTAAVAEATATISDCVAAGAKSFFCVMLPDDPSAARSDNFGYMVEGFGALMPTLEQHGARLVVEGWPGPGALCCTPETYRAFFEAMGSDAACVNYDPSHLLRMGVDPLMFLSEFVDRVGHVHGKDTEIMAERQYELGTEQPATFAEGIAFGGGHWRYTIPGHGVTRWCEVFAMLETAGYDGYVSIELEDANFNGTEAGEKQGFVLSRQYLAGC